MRGFFEEMPSIAVPFGDDVSAVSVGEDDVAVLKTDLLVGKTDIPNGMTLWQAARKAIVMNVSDFASKGVQPTAVLASLGLPRNLASEDIEQIAIGLNAGAREYGAYVVGGDTGEATDLIIAVYLYGTAKKDALMRRKGAKAGDVLAVTGVFGKSAAGLQILLGNACRASASDRQILLDAMLMPKARLLEGLALSRSRAVSASMDSSDGLAWCLHELAGQNEVGFTVTDLPVAAETNRFAKLNKLNPVELALYGGEEYELVLTVKPDFWEAAQAAVSSVGGKLLRIGQATENRQILLDLDGKKQKIEARGYEQLKR
jgi:thiamine-monophosphate kinase